MENVFIHLFVDGVSFHGNKGESIFFHHHTNISIFINIFIYIYINTHTPSIFHNEMVIMHEITRLNF